MIEDKIYIVTVEITGKCQNRCIHCYYFSRSHANLHDMPFEKYKRVVNEISETLKYPTVFGYRGGEPTIHKNFLEILKFTRDVLHDYFINLSTNGVKFNREILKYVDEIGITIHSHIKEVHEKIARSQTFEKTVKTVKALAEENIYTNTPLNRINSPYILETLEFLYKLGVKKIVFNQAISANPEYMLTPEELGAVCYKIKKFADDLGIEVKFSISPPLCLFNPNLFGVETYACGLGRSAIEINPKGDISPCAFTSIKYGNLFKNGLEESWNSKTAEFWKDKESYLSRISPECLKCKLLPECGGICMGTYKMFRTKIRAVR